MSENVKEFMLTTVDNPYDPFTQYDEWYAFDIRMGYGTASFLGRVAKTSDELSSTDQQLVINQAIQEIVEENVLGLYMKVERDSEDDQTLSA